MLRICLVACLVLGGLSGAEDVRVADATEERFRLVDLLPNSVQKNPKIALTVMTDMTEEGRARPVPSAQAPTYYAIVDGGQVEEGDPVAGDAWPTASELARVLGSSLAQGGYLPAAPGHPPTVMVHYRWGILNRREPVSGASAVGGNAELPDSDDRVQMKNFVARAMFVGGEKFTRDLLHAIKTHSLDAFRARDWQTDDLVSLVFCNLYVILASGYDYEALQRGEKKLLWKTRIATDSHGLVLRETLPALVRNAGVYIGHETASVMLRRRLLTGRVDMGEPVFEEYKGELPKAADGRK